MVGVATKVSRKSPLLKAEGLSRIPWLFHGFSTRQGGVSRVYGGHALNLGFTKEDVRRDVEKNRSTFLEVGGVNGRNRAVPLVTLRQIHSDLIHRVDDLPKQTLVGDGLVSDTPGIVLAIQTADCLPVIVVDTKRRAVGVFHAGWRGTIQRIVEKGVGEMRRWFGSRPRDLRAAIGPGVHRCCYQVGEEVRENFESQFAYANSLFRETKERNEIHERYPLLFLTARAPGHSDLPKKIFLDLVEANRRQLRAVGVLQKNISASALCTACNVDQLFSYRAEKGITGRMMGAVGINLKQRTPRPLE
jgi:polyphenol oxidase